MINTLFKSPVCIVSLFGSGGESEGRGGVDPATRAGEGRG